MVKVEVKYILKKGQRNVFYNAIVEQVIDVAAKNEAGNIKYDFDIPADEPDILYLHEIWADAEALAMHGQMAHYAELAVLKEEYVLETIIDKQEI